MSNYQSKGYHGDHRRSRRRLLALIYALATVFVVLGLIVAVINTRSGEQPPPARSVGTASPQSPTASPDAAGLGGVDQAAGQGDGGGGGEEGPAGPVDQGEGGTDSGGCASTVARRQ